MDERDTQRLQTNISRSHDSPLKDTPNVERCEAAAVPKLHSETTQRLAPIYKIRGFPEHVGGT